MSYAYVPCKDPECGGQTLIREFEATRTEPGDVDRAECEECDGPLDWDGAEPVSIEELRYEAQL